MSERMPKTPDENWRAKANCKDEENPDIFTPDSENTGGKNREEIKRAKNICRACSVKAECLADSYTGERASPGIWGGEPTSTRDWFNKHLGLTAYSWSQRVDAVRTSISGFE